MWFEATEYMVQNLQIDSQHIQIHEKQDWALEEL